MASPASDFPCCTTPSSRNRLIHVSFDCPRLRKTITVFQVITMHTTKLPMYKKKIEHSVSLIVKQCWITVPTKLHRDKYLLVLIFRNRQPSAYAVVYRNTVDRRCFTWTLTEAIVSTVLLELPFGTLIFVSTNYSCSLGRKTVGGLIVSQPELWVETSSSTRDSLCVPPYSIRR